MDELKEGTNIIPIFLFEDYYKYNLSELPIKSRIEVTSALHYDHANILMEITRPKENTWNITLELRSFSYKDPLLEQIVKEKQKYESLDIVLTKKRFYELKITINEDIELGKLNEKVEWIKKDIIKSKSCAQNMKLYPTVKTKVLGQLPIYERAKNKIMLELKSFAKEVDKNECNIVQVLGRIKDIRSIEEKVYRKNISQYKIFSEFDDIAGVRAICEYTSDVYKLLEYISEHPLLNVNEIDDKINSPTKEGYRAIHIIVAVEIYYDKDLFENIQVEIQLRTSFQNAWSMKTHELTYKREEIIPDEILGQMQKLGETLNSADEEAEILKQKIKNIKK